MAHKISTVQYYLNDLATRNPKVLKRISGLFPKRIAARTFDGELFHDPPRSTRFLPSPCQAPATAGAPS